jgi:hypothetical protein
MPEPGDLPTDEPPGGQLPDDFTEDDVAKLVSEFATKFGAGASDTFFGSFQDALPAEVIEALEGVIVPGMPTVDEFLTTHERMRRLVGDARQKPAPPEAD